MPGGPSQSTTAAIATATIAAIRFIRRLRALF
jgi:hypothetical protein